MNENKVTEAQIDAEILDKHFVATKDKRIVCELYLRNGLFIRGEGKNEEDAYKEARNALKCFILKRPVEDFLVRMELEGKELDERIRKANAYLVETLKEYVPDPENTGRDSNIEMDLLQAQVTAMTTYSNILLLRVNVERSKRGLPTIAQF